MALKHSMRSMACAAVTQKPATADDVIDDLRPRPEPVSQSLNQLRQLIRKAVVLRFECSTLLQL